MARTIGAKPKQPTKEGRTIEYKGFTVTRMSNDELWIFDKNDKMIGKADSVQDFRDIIDTQHTMKKTEETPVKKSNRTIMPKKVKPVEKEEYPRGGHIKNPVEDCEKKVKFEKGGNWWVECVICAFHCPDNIDCPTYREFLTGRKERIRKMNNGEDK